ncbi:DUF4097 and DUF4098 domain-containing protein YvlB [Rhodanobacter sp. TND4EL1]
MRRFPTILISAAFALALPLLAAAQGGDIDKVNGAVRVAAGEQAGDVSTVNGAVYIADGAVVKKASTVNGAVELGAKAQASELDTVNGSISLGADGRVSGKVGAVNGSIRLDQGADVGGRLENVNGAIVLNDAHVGAGIGTVAGDITVGANSRVEGGILVDKAHGWFSGNRRAPVVVIGPHAVVQGTLEFRREVVLKVSDSAQIGPVKGATAVKFSGATP